MISKNAMFICNTNNNRFDSYLIQDIYPFDNMSNSMFKRMFMNIHELLNLLNWKPSSKSAPSLTPSGLSILAKHQMEWWMLIIFLVILAKKTLG